MDEAPKDSGLESLTPSNEESLVPTRHSPYPLRVREPKRRWEESFLSFAISPEAVEPQSYQEALSSPDRQHWEKAIKEELDSISQNQTWTLKELPPDCNVVKSRWIFKIKPGVKGSPPRFKARLVAKGYSQRYGIDYEETLAPVARMETLRTILSFVAAYDMEMSQLDVKTDN